MLHSRVLVTYMEQTAPPPVGALPAPHTALRIAPERLDADTYLRLYEAVGGPHRWSERLGLSQEALSALLQMPTSRLFILRHEDRAIGLCEFLNVAAPDVELKYFGLVADAQGRGVGPYFLDACLRQVWLRRPERIWLHTDTNDHPKARVTYERSGFRTYDERWQNFPD